MTFFQAIFLAVIQGLTEFLPVSSSGHLVLFQKTFGLIEPPVFFDILLHLGTLAAVLFFLKNEIIDLVVNWKKRAGIWFLIIAGSIPAALFGCILDSKIGSIFNSLKLTGAMWMLFGLLLLSLKLMKGSSGNKELRKINLIDAFIVGLFQAVALFPGISRSGSTIAGGLLRGFSSKTAFSFSFLLSIPVVLGAIVLEAKNARLSEISLRVSLVSVLTACFVGYWTLKFLQRVLKLEKFYYFGFYCLVLGAIAIVAF